ncbi:hypothetical protein QRX60_13120 [Amycolatopsis mongoliensis]|uniref:Uncharacterized protein n=1 Tax=Amycolatopsis mongoliensis TaxID=715475 RepID=A0A9Y2JWE3_9PSEU|nr:hypothetical protein [Amycolatopsis sp. 4-36]WIY04732.1 hypothetical protein QRX60_13120 [Amycolatopsis sp. 4-36]
MSKKPGNVDDQQLNVVARRVLLDGLTALATQLPAVTVVGAQAVYLRTPDVPLTTSAFTSDGDLSLDPLLLVDEPLIERALRDAGFELMDANQPGLWRRLEVVTGTDEPVPVELDLLVGETLAPNQGRRSARIPPHDPKTAKKVPGLEVAAVDRSPLTITALESQDLRAITVNVAGPVALLVAKAYKIHDRLSRQAIKPARLSDKDAADVYRVMLKIEPRQIVAGFESALANDRVGGVAAKGLWYLQQQFGGSDTPGVRMAVAALAGDADEAAIRRVVPAYVNQIRRSIKL